MFGSASDDLALLADGVFQGHRGLLLPRNPNGHRFDIRVGFLPNCCHSVAQCETRQEEEAGHITAREAHSTFRGLSYGHWGLSIKETDPTVLDVCEGALRNFGSCSSCASYPSASRDGETSKRQTPSIPQLPKTSTCQVASTVTRA